MQMDEKNKMLKTFLTIMLVIDENIWKIINFAKQTLIWFHMVEQDCFENSILIYIYIYIF